MKNPDDDCKSTPLTDAAIERVNVSFVGHEGLSSYEADYVSPDFARDLERKLAAAEERIAELEGKLKIAKVGLGSASRFFGNAGYDPAECPSYFDVEMTIGALETD